MDIWTYNIYNIERTHTHSAARIMHIYYTYIYIYIPTVVNGDVRKTKILKTALLIFNRNMYRV